MKKFHIIDTEGNDLYLTNRQLNFLLELKGKTWKQLLKLGKMPIIRATYELWGIGGDPTINYFKTASKLFRLLKLLPVFCDLETQDNVFSFPKPKTVRKKKLTVVEEAAAWTPSEGYLLWRRQLYDDNFRAA